MPIDENTLQQFTARAGEILAANPLEQEPMKHSYSKWEKGLQTSPSALAALNECFRFLGGELTISREHIFRAVHEQLNPQARFLMQMIWGYSPTAHYGPARVLKLFQSPTLSDINTYGNIMTLILGENLTIAFEQLCEINGLNTSYVTKVLYFESRHLARIPKYALIMDDRVSLGLVNVTSPWAGSCVISSAPRALFGSNWSPIRRHNQIHRAWQKYWAYVEGCHDIADNLQTEADHVEFFLFNQG